MRFFFRGSISALGLSPVTLPVPNLDEFFSKHSARLERELTRAVVSLPPPTPNLDDAALYSMGLDEPGGGGKRVRPLLCLLTCDACGGDLEAAWPFAVAIELMHNFALVHDDIEDGDAWRRGRPAVWKQFGTDHAINVGDFLLNRAYLHLASAGLHPELTHRYVALLSTTLDATIRGQALDMNARRAQALTPAQYREIVVCKTGQYLAAPLVAGAIAAAADASTIEQLARLGPILGPLFQILDDLIDLTAGKGRDSVGSDIREGKRSFLVVHALERLSAGDRATLLEILDRPRAETSNDAVAQAIELMRAAGAMDAARAETEALREQAMTTLTALEPERLRQAVMVVIERLAQRST